MSTRQHFIDKTLAEFFPGYRTNHGPIQWTTWCVHCKTTVLNHPETNPPTQRRIVCRLVSCSSRFVIAAISLFEKLNRRAAESRMQREISNFISQTVG